MKKLLPVLLMLAALIGCAKMPLEEEPVGAVGILH